MEPIEKIEKLFEEIVHGNYAKKNDLFETIWVNCTRLATQPEAKPLLSLVSFLLRCYLMLPPVQPTQLTSIKRIMNTIKKNNK